MKGKRNGSSRLQSKTETETKALLFCFGGDILWEAVQLSHGLEKKKRSDARNRTDDGTVMPRSEPERLAHSATDNVLPPVISKGLSIYLKHLKDRASKNALGNNVVPIAAS